MPIQFRDCFSEFLPTAAYVGFLSDRTMTFRLTVRDGHPGGGGIGSRDTRVTVAPTAGPFLVTSHAAPATLRGGYDADRDLGRGRDRRGAGRARPT